MKTDKQQNDERASRAWKRATDACQPLSRDRRAYLLRWCVARRFNGFEPQPGQVNTRDLVRRFAGEVCQAMGIDMMSPPDRTLQDDEPYQAALELVAPLDGGQRRCLIEWLVRDEPRELRGKALTLALNLRDLEKMRTINANGWKEGGRPRRRRGRKKR